MYNVSNYIPEQFEDFAESLPHGSGIDGEWDAHQSTNYVYFTNSYHCMDEFGGYDGWQDFSVRISRELFSLAMKEKRKIQVYQHMPSNEEAKKRYNVLIGLIADNFCLQFNDSQYLANKYMLRDYLEETIHYYITEMLDKNA